MPLSDPLELWGGVECTVNRVGDHFFDQMERNGHAWRDDDLERFASLGLRALRYPVLWERLAPDQAEVTDWSWADLLLDQENGVWHLSNAGTLNRAMFRAYAAEIMRAHVPAYKHLLPQADRMNSKPAGCSALSSHRGDFLPPWQSAVRHLTHTNPSLLAPPPN